MIELLLIAITWYITKLFYTRDIRINIPQRESDLMDAICSKCAQTIVIRKENMRTPFYCMVCK
jgi:formylmethanofuran dehydrogenase subunit E